MSAGAFDAANTKASLATAVSAALDEISGDLHFSFGVDPQWIDEFRMAKDPAHRDELRSAEKLREAATNYRSDEVRRLEGNIGYFRFNHFAVPDLAYQTATVAMQFLENSDAIISTSVITTADIWRWRSYWQLPFSCRPRPPAVRLRLCRRRRNKGNTSQSVLPGLPSRTVIDEPVDIPDAGTTTYAASPVVFPLPQETGAGNMVWRTHLRRRTCIDAQNYIRNNCFIPVINRKRSADPINGKKFEGTHVVTGSQHHHTITHS